MTRIIITLFLSILSLLANAQDKIATPEEGITINVTIDNISRDKGIIYFALFDSKENFIQRETFQSVEGEIKDKQTNVHFNNVPKGVYAITCYHDANGNQKMDFDGYMPVEDYGSSNNPTLFGPPQFEVSKFEVNEEDISIEIRF